MKNLRLLFIVVFCLFTASFSANATTLYSELTKYKIVAVDDIAMYKSAEKVWNLTYEGCSNPVVVVKRIVSGDAAYIVRTEYFEVCYCSSAKGFGTRALKRSWSTVPPQLNDAVINQHEVDRQEIITAQRIDDESALELIASYLPELLNENYRHLLYN
jgi:hypothetical protein